MKSSGGKASSKGEMKKDRISRTGMSGSPKKGGHGGKYTWAGGDHLSTYQVKADEFKNGAMDAKDPNFEDPIVDTKNSDNNSTVTD